MATTTSNKKTKSSSSNKKHGYITDKKALKYIEKHCDKALEYCQQEGLTSFEEFAATVEALSNSEGKNGKINAEINGSGVVFSLENHPKLGTVTGKYLMKNLGYEEEEQSKFTKQGVEEVLGLSLENEEGWEEEDFDEALQNYQQLEDEDKPQSSPSQNRQNNRKTQNSVDSILDELEEDFEEEPQNCQQLEDEDQPQKPPSQNRQNNRKTQTVNTTLDELDEIDPQALDDDEFLDEETSSPPQKKPHQSQNSQRLNKKSKTSLGKIANIVTEIGEQAISNDLDGLTISGASGVIGISAATLLAKTLQNAIEHLDDKKDQEALKKTTKRIISADNQAEELANRTEELATKIERLNKLEKEKPALNNTEQETESQNSTVPNILSPFAQITNQLIEKISQTEERLNSPEQSTEKISPKLSPIKIDPSSDFKSQLKQINKALDKIDQRLENLEAKISKLEEQLAELTQNANPKKDVPNAPLSSQPSNSSFGLDKIVDNAKTKLKNIVKQITNQEKLQEENVSLTDDNFEEEDFEEINYNDLKSSEKQDQNLAENLLTLHTHLEKANLIEPEESLTIDVTQNIKSSAYVEEGRVTVEISLDDRILFQAEKTSSSPNAWQFNTPDHKLFTEEKQTINESVSELNEWADEQNKEFSHEGNSPLQKFVSSENNGLKKENNSPSILLTRNHSKNRSSKREDLEM